MNTKFHIVRLLLLLFGLSATLSARTAASDGGHDSYIFSEIDRQQGLSNSAVICIYKDDSELMWFGTYDGVNCFDGSQMEIFRADFSKSRTLDNNVIYGIGKADGNNLWISTLLGVNRFSRDERQVVANYTVPSGTYLCSNGRGNTWLVGYDSLAYYNTHDHAFVGIKVPNLSVSDPQARSFVAADGDLWLFPDSGEGGDLCRISLSAFDQKAAAVKFTVAASRFHHKVIETLFYQDDQSFCFVDADKGLYMYDIGRQTKVYIRNIQPLLEKYGPIVGIVPFYDDFMIAFHTNGLVRLKATESYREEVINRNLRIFALYKDPVQGVLWIGVDGKGAMMYTKQYSVATNLMMQSLSPNFTRQVRCVMTDKRGGVWFGTKGDGLIHIPDYTAGADADKAVVYFPERRQTASTYTRGDTEFPVFTLCQSNYMDGIWVGSGSEGLFYHRFAEAQLRHLDLPSGERMDEVHEVYEADDSTLYVATANSGFFRLTLDRAGGNIAVKTVKKYRFFHEQQEIRTFFTLLPEGDSIVWLGSREKGLIRFETATENYRVVSPKALLNRPVDDVLCLCRARNGDLLAGTTAGLVRLHFEPGGGVGATYVGREQGLLNDMIHGMLEDANGFLWLSTNKGLIKYNPINGSSHAYYYSGGVRIGEFSDDAYYKCPYSGRLFFGGIDGLLYIDRTSTAGDEYYPEILLRKLIIGREEANMADCYTSDRGALRFSYADEGFSLEFAAPDFISGTDLEYSWMLEGYDSEWSRFGMLREAVYPDVPVGNYVFRVRYRKDIFDTDFKTFSIPLRILPRWYQTVVARLLFVVLALAAVLYFIYILHNFIRQKRIISKLLESENGNTLKAGAAYWNHEIVNVLTSVYRACDTLRDDKSLYRQRSETIELIRENVMSLLLPADVSSKIGSEKFPPPPVRFSVAGRMYLKEISDGVLSLLRERGFELDNIDVEIPRDLSFAVYKNAFRLLFDYVYAFVAGSRRFTVSASEDGEMMTLTFRSSRSVLARLHESLTGETYPQTPLSDTDSLFGMHLLHSFVREGLAQLEPVIALSDTGEEPELSLSFRPAVGEEHEAGKKIVLLLEDHDEMFWFVNGILSADYVVYQARSVQQAVEFMESSNPAVFLVDMMMYINAEDTFMEFINRNGSLLTQPAFVPMLTWKISSNVQRSLILHADSFVMLPYDIVFLKEIIHKAIYGRLGTKQIYVEGLGENITSLVTCTTSEQATFIRKIVAIIEDNIDSENLGSTFIAEQLAMSSRQFYRKFKEISEHSPAEFIKNYRLDKASVLLLDDKLAIKDVMAEIGITSRSYLYREFSAKFGMTPSDWRSQHGGGKSE